MSPKKRGRRPPPRKSAAASQRREPAATRPPVRPGTAFYTPGGGTFRHSVERTSAPLLLLLTSAPRFVVTATPLILVLLGFFLPLALGLIALGIFFVLTGWLAYLSWPRTDLRARAIRVAMFVLVIALVVVRVSRG